MTNDTPLFTRSQLRELTGLDAQSLDYWLRNEFLRASSGGGGKGQHRKFDSLQVTLGRILFELQKLGLNGNALKAVAQQFPDAIEWFTKNEIAGYEEIAYSLVSHRHDIDQSGYTSVPDSDMINALGDNIPGIQIEINGEALEPRRQLNRRQFREYERLLLSKLGDRAERLIERVDAIDFNEFMIHINPFVVLSKYFMFFDVDDIYLFKDETDEWEISYNVIPEEPISYIAIDIRFLKDALWKPAHPKSRFKGISEVTFDDDS